MGPIIQSVSIPKGGVYETIAFLTKAPESVARTNTTDDKSCIGSFYTRVRFLSQIAIMSQYPGACLFRRTHSEL